MNRNVFKGSGGSSSNVLLGLAVAAAIALAGQQASAHESFYLQGYPDLSIPFGTTTIYLNGTVTNLDPCATARGVTVANRDASRPAAVGAWPAAGQSRSSRGG